MNTQVGIIGAGPAGLFLSRLLHNNGVRCVILEKKSEKYIRKRERSGILEHTSMEEIVKTGIGERLIEKGRQHQGVYFHFDEKKKFLNVRELNEGRSVISYSQKNLLLDLLDKAHHDEISIRFNSTVTSLENLDSTKPIINFTKGGKRDQLNCDLIVGCDGFHGVSRSFIPHSDKFCYQKTYPYSLLGVLVDSPPIFKDIVFAHHEDGFAIQSMRGASMTKYYLQCSNESSLDEWADDKIWLNLEKRLNMNVRKGHMVDKTIVPLKSFICTELQYKKSLFIAGDAAHIMPPTGAKGMNCAIADVTLLSKAIIEHLKDGDDDLLSNYSNIALKRIWSVMKFSDQLTSTLYIHPSQTSFDTRLQIELINHLFDSIDHARDFAKHYSGLPINLS